MNKIIEISFNEVDIFEKEIISFHIPHSKKLNDDHKYFKKRIVWTLIEWKDTGDYPMYRAEDLLQSAKWKMEDILNDISQLVEAHL